VGTRCLRGSFGAILLARLHGDLRRGLVAPPLEQITDLIGHVARRLHARRDLISIDPEHVCNHRRPRSLGLMLTADILREEFFSRCALSFAAACADEKRSVTDNPLASFLIEVESWTLGATRHC